MLLSDAFGLATVISIAVGSLSLCLALLKFDSVVFNDAFGLALFTPTSVRFDAFECIGVLSRFWLVVLLLIDPIPLMFLI